MKNKNCEEIINQKDSQNLIRIADFVVSSNTEPLDKVKEVMDNLISKHKDFCALRVHKKYLEDSNGIV